MKNTKKVTVQKTAKKASVKKPRAKLAKVINSSNPFRVSVSGALLFALVFGTFVGLGVVLIKHVSAKQLDVISNTKWSSTDSCKSGKYDMESVVTWGPIRNDNRLISSVKVQRGQINGESVDKRIDYTIYVEYDSGGNSSWAEFKKYGPYKSADGPVVINPDNPPAATPDDTRIRVTAGVDGDGVKGCTVTYQSYEPEGISDAPILLPPDTSDDRNISGVLKTENVSLGVEKESYGSIAKLNKKYKKINIATVADSAKGKIKQCAFKNTVDSRLSWKKSYCFGDLEKWRFQGIAGVGSSGWAARSDIVLMSQYIYVPGSRDKNGNRSRVVIVNSSTNKYEIVELVRPCNSSKGYCEIGTGYTGPGCRESHASGLAWYKKTLFMSDGNCFIAFDVNNFLKLSNGTIILPTTHYWHWTSQKLNFSTVALDTTTPTPQILSTQYAEGSECKKKRYIGRWDLNNTDGDILPDPGKKVASADGVLSIMDLCEVQGIASYKGMYYFNSSDNRPHPYYLWRYKTLSGNPANKKFEMPRSAPEGIYFDVKSNLGWSVNEHDYKGGPVIYSFGLSAATQ